MPKAQARSQLKKISQSPRPQPGGERALALRPARPRADQDAGVDVPGEISITGFDDFDFARNVASPLTAVRVPTVEMGRGAAEQLLLRLSGQPALHATLLPVAIMPRGTTSPAPSDRGASS